MPRKIRFYASGIPSHIVQRGNNKQACFFCDDDYGFYIKALSEALIDNNVKLHAFVLMTNHVHLLMTPNDHQGISKVMQSVGRKYVRYINGIYNRTGTLWEGRHKASLIDSERYFLICQRYIELNPVRAGIVDVPSDYTWSSYQHNGVGKIIRCITPHDEYLKLGHSTQSRLENYRILFSQAISVEHIQNIRECLIHNFPFGDKQFKAQLEQTLAVKLGQLKQGRPVNEVNK
ncbi:transposase [Pseudoalteromonas denitrificans]|uniref:Putative transposase n=1 Tax=Pseudoalteromonas denitrificans DSM 6059 TaxID=1123010 RepID=A0A1I1LKA3_9GAMM|nr:transposase [Pseudoalteromonas denitrificans]SFC71398.1 putative transposase [Pseudoalteromonas denitrificans DSM 6059]